MVQCMHAIMSMQTRDGTEIFYKDWGSGQPIVFSHGWPLSSDAWDIQMMYFAMRGFRVIALDRRGHGRSAQPWQGNNMNTYADDLAELIDKLRLQRAILVGHSTGGGEVARYVGRHGTERIAKVVLLSAVVPLMVQSASNPSGVPMAVLDGIRNGVLGDRSQFFRELSASFYGYNRPGARESLGLRESFWLQSMQCSIKAAFDCIKEFSETDFTRDLEKINVPTLIAHGDDDQIVPIEVTARRAVKLLRSATLKVYAGAPHGLPQTRPDEFNADLFSFIKA
jgi:non-heme chloroperoxidase